MHVNLSLHPCPNTELLLNDTHQHDQIKSQQSRAHLHLMCLFLDLYYNGSKLMINNNPSSHYLVALIIEYLKEFVSYLHMYAHTRIYMYTHIVYVYT